MRSILFLISFMPSLCLAQKVIPVYLTFNKTVHMFFPDSVNYFDAGSDDILISRMGAILKLAPKSDNIDETNLTVITAHNVCYSFLLRYSKDIKDLTYFIDDSIGKKIAGPLREKGPDENLPLAVPLKSGESEYIAVCRDVIKRAPAYWIGSTVKKVYLAMNNIYVHNDKLYFCISIGNTSNINYDINFLKFYIVDKKKLKKASIQEIEKVPIFSFNNLQTINAQTNDYPLIFVFDKFTIDYDKKLVIELGEKKGGRNIAIDITQDLIIKAVAFKQ